MGVETYEVGLATASEQREALELSLTPLPASARGPLVETVAYGPSQALGPLSALVVARDGNGVAAACWAQPAPGRSACLWPAIWRKKPADDSANQCESDMAQLASSVCDSAGVRITQALFEEPDDYRIEVLKSAGFQWIAELEYLSCVVDPRATKPAQKLVYDPYEASQRERLKRVLKATYEQTLDCPGLDGMRDMDDVLSGYQATGKHDPSMWHILVENGQDVGALLLAEHPGADQLELIYMGLVPSARGRGLGTEIVGRALQVAAEVGAEQVVVAVDCANDPARKAYQQMGFAPWTRRTVLIRRPASLA